MKRFYLILLFLLININLFAAEEQNQKKDDFSVGCLSYLTYGSNISGGEFGNSDFSIGRSYLTVTKSITKILNFRATLDVYSSDKGYAYRMKYAYAHFKFDDFGPITKPNIEFGLVHTPWLDFEEHINYYRMQGTMYMERSHIFNSADYGINILGYIGGEMDKEYKSSVNSKYAGRYGSFAFGLFNGGGYDRTEKNKNKTFQGRLTIRPLPDIISGLQVSFFGIFGDGNTKDSLDISPEWTMNAVMASYENSFLTLTGQYLDGSGDKNGDYIDVSNNKSAKYSGYSVFAEGKLGSGFKVIGRYDYIDSDSDIDNLNLKRTILGIGYDLGGQNIILLHAENEDYKNPSMKTNTMLKLTMQVKFDRFF